LGKLAMPFAGQADKAQFIDDLMPMCELQMAVLG
jgi:hypothetical protein